MISLTESKKKINHIDHQRKQLREHFVRDKNGLAPFDVTFNYFTLDEDDIIAAIVRLVEVKDLI